jgi:hypothetical protein
MRVHEAEDEYKWPWDPYADKPISQHGSSGAHGSTSELERTVNKPVLYVGGEHRGIRSMLGSLTRGYIPPRRNGVFYCKNVAVHAGHMQCTQNPGHGAENKKAHPG